MPDSIASAAGGQNRGRGRGQDWEKVWEQEREQEREGCARTPDSAAVQKARPEAEDAGAAETACLLASPVNAERLMASIREAGLARERGLIWPDEEEAQQGKGPQRKRPEAGQAGTGRR